MANLHSKLSWWNQIIDAVQHTPFFLVKVHLRWYEDEEQVWLELTVLVAVDLKNLPLR